MDELLAHLPMAVVVLVLGLVFKKPLFAWLNRFGRLKTGDTVLEMASQIEQQVNASKGNQISGDGLLSSGSSVITSAAAVLPTTALAPVPNPARGKVLRTVGISPLVIKREEEIRRDVLNIPEAEQRDLLIRNLAICQLQKTAEEVYRLIYGSQLALLHHLHLFGPEPREKLVEQFYDPAMKKYPAIYAKIPLDRFFHFLQTSDLIQTSGENGPFAITEKGKAFLEWLVSEGILAQKPF
jgi:hypothetical protein